MQPSSVTVVIPVFNGERFLEQAITSALEQTRPPDEIIVIDDGSTDASRAIAQRFDGRVRCLLQDHQGPGAARNLATDAATSTWIAFLDADDYWLRDKLERQLQLAEAKPATGVIYTGATALTADGSTIDQYARSPEWVVKRLAFADPLCLSAVLARRALLLQERWDTTLGSSEDWWLLYRLSRRSEFAVIEEPTTVFRVHGESLTHRDWRAVFRYAEEVAERIQQDFSGSDRYILHRQVRARLLTSAAIAARAQGTGGFLTLMTSSLVTWPFGGTTRGRYRTFALMVGQTIRRGMSGGRPG